MSQDISTVVESLAQIGRWFERDGRVPPEVFDAICEYLITTPIELAVLKLGGNDSEILMVYREDKYFTGWHMPGSVVLPGRTAEGIFPVLLRRELGLEFARLRNKPKFVISMDVMKGSGPDQCNRGQEVNRLYTLWLEEAEAELIQPDDHRRFFPLNRIPDDVLPHHRTMIELIWKRRTQPTTEPV